MAKKKRSVKKVVWKKESPNPSLMLTMLIVIFVGVVYVFFAQPYSTGRAVAIKCTDSDGGLNYYVNGVVRANGINYKDSCAGKILSEKYCYIGNARSKLFTCPDVCTNGACVNSTVVCKNECVKSGQIQCYGQSCTGNYSVKCKGYTVCGQYDTDPCLEWSLNNTCPGVCYNNACIGI